MSDPDYLSLVDPIVGIVTGALGAGVSALIYWAKFLSPKMASRIEEHVTHATEKVRADFERDRERRGEITVTYKELLGAVFMMREEAIQIVRVAWEENHNQGPSSPIPSPDEENLAKFTRLCGWSVAVLPKDAADTVREMATELQKVEQDLSNECIEHGRSYAHFMHYAEARARILRDFYDRLVAQARKDLGVP